MPEKTAIIECPSCKRRVEWSPRSRYRPFCSRRCKLIDLGAWLDGSHRIAGPELDDESVSSHEDADNDAHR